MLWYRVPADIAVNHQDERSTTTQCSNTSLPHPRTPRTHPSRSPQLHNPPRNRLSQNNPPLSHNFFNLAPPHQDLDSPSPIPLPSHTPSSLRQRTNSHLAHQTLLPTLHTQLLDPHPPPPTTQLGLRLALRTILPPARPPTHSTPPLDLLSRNQSKTIPPSCHSRQ